MLLTNCANIATSTKQYKDMDKLLLQRDVPAVITQVESNKGKSYKDKDMVLYYLDLGLLQHYNGDYEGSNTSLSEAERLMEELYTQSISKAALSLLLNDNSLDYCGEDYEDVYTNVIKALNYLQQNKFDDAFVEIRRIDLKLGMLEDKYGKLASGLNSSKDKKLDMQAGTNHFHNSALGRYLSMLIYEKEGKPDDAALDLTKIGEAFAAQPEIYNFSQPPLSDSLNAGNQPKLNIVSLIGRAPYKLAREFHIATSKDQVTIVSVDKSVDEVKLVWPGIDPNYYFKFSFPYIVDKDTDICRVNAVVDGKTFELGKLEDVGNVAVQTFKIKEPVIFLKSVTRSILKGIAAEAAKDKMKQKNPGLTGALMGFATDVAVAASENADLRISRFFPNDVLVTSIPLPPGEHSVVIEYYNKDNVLLYRDDKGTVEVNPERLNLVESWNIR